MTPDNILADEVAEYRKQDEVHRAQIKQLLKEKEETAEIRKLSDREVVTKCLSLVNKWNRLSDLGFANYLPEFTHSIVEGLVAEGEQIINRYK